MILVYKNTIRLYRLRSRKRTQWWIPWKVIHREQSDQFNVFNDSWFSQIVL